MQRNQARRVDIDLGRHRSSQAVPLQPRELARLPQNGAAAPSRKPLTTSLAEHTGGSDPGGVLLVLPSLWLTNCTCFFIDQVML